MNRPIGVPMVLQSNRLGGGMPYVNLSHREYYYLFSFILVLEKIFILPYFSIYSAYKHEMIYTTKRVLITWLSLAHG